MPKNTPPRRAWLVAAYAVALSYCAACDRPAANAGEGPTEDASGAVNRGADSHNGDDADADLGAWGEPWQCDVEHLELAFELAEAKGVDKGTAKVRIAATCAGKVSLSAPGLVVASVSPGEHRIVDGRLDIRAPHGTTEVTIVYTFKRHDAFAGLTKRGSTTLWPEFCGNLFPCHPAMSDGATYTLSVTGALPKGDKAVYPASIDKPAPAYMPGFAIGAYSYKKLGVTAQGTEVGCWTLPSSANPAEALTDLPKMFGWLEQTLGSYGYGKKVAGVAVDWGLQYGGLENHPYWHVSHLAMDDVTIHAHEAAHGWFGSGVRLACWHDLVMSEGTADYLAAEAVEAIQGKEAAGKIWKAYEAHYEQKVKTGQDKIVWPKGCGDVAAAHGLLSQLLYKKGALFWRDVGKLVGKDALHKALRSFYEAHVHKAAKLDDLIAHVESKTGKSIASLVEKWLRTKKSPS